jgi:hypothetical protein
MNISYSDPLSRAWNRMKKTLLQPFDIGKWFSAGFTAFLAALMSGPGGPGGSGNYSMRDNMDALSWADVIEWPNIACYWLINHPI